MIDLIQKEIDFEPSNFIGTMRVDFADGNLANKFFKGERFELAKDDLKEIQNVMNYITFDKYPTFKSVVKECCGEGYPYEKWLMGEYNNYVYAVKFIPVMGDYNYYIKAYKK